MEIGAVLDRRVAVPDSSELARIGADNPGNSNRQLPPIGANRRESARIAKRVSDGLSLSADGRGVKGEGFNGQCSMFCSAGHTDPPLEVVTS